VTYEAVTSRYDSMPFRRVGRSGLKLPAISLGLGWNFGRDRDYASAVGILKHAFDRGVTHFDLANNYGPPVGAAEELFGQVMAKEFRPYRSELIITSKAGWQMWPGPYGDMGSRKYLLTACEQSLKRLGLDYVDIFYSHRFDPNTPLEETMGALAQLHRQGKALYVGISSYPRQQTIEAHRILKEMGVPLLAQQPSYSILDRWIQNDGTIDACADLGIGIVAYSPLARGVLSGKYSGRSANSPPVQSDIEARSLQPAVLAGVDALGAIARARGQTLVQLALAWVLHRREVASALIGIRTIAQLDDCLATLTNADLSAAELAAIDQAVSGARLDDPPPMSLPD
jgi:L-glyceraldehyde 3-phosphate reductase